ncbi:AaceriAGL327Wp [[Ashbya] aceris (nom. inval.)]|nr:AaceriAGL327Wp [[Ashbya] aceris (nom. inval.)]
MKQLTASEQYLLASKARHKLIYAARTKGQDHQLRVLVGHANMLDRITAALGSARSAPRSGPAEGAGGHVAARGPYGGLGSGGVPVGAGRARAAVSGLAPLAGGTGQQVTCNITCASAHRQGGCPSGQYSCCASQADGDGGCTTGVTYPYVHGYAECSADVGGAEKYSGARLAGAEREAGEDGFSECSERAPLRPICI